MALTWDVSKIKKAYRRISKEEFNTIDKKISLFSNPKYYDSDNDSYYELRTETNTMIFICGIFVGIPTITKENYKKVYERIRFSEILNGSAYLKRVNPLTQKSEEMPITLNMVKNHIGLKTNGVKMTKSQFLKKTTQGWEL